MRFFYTVIFLTYVFIQNVNAQKDSARNDIPQFDGQSLRFGIAIGPSRNLNETYSSSLSPVNSLLKIQNNSPYGFSLSTAIIYNKLITWRKLENGKPVGEPYKYPSKWSLVAALNIAELSNGEVGFNKRIEGGIGAGFRIDPNFHIVALLDFTSVRQIRDYIRTDFENKAIPTAAGTNLNALDEQDNTLFFSKPIVGISFRFVYVFGKNIPNITNSEPVKR